MEGGDYSGAILALAAITLLVTAAVLYILTRPSDLPPN